MKKPSKEEAVEQGRAEYPTTARGGGARGGGRSPCPLRPTSSHRR
jgi:hypothetical protein